MNVFEVTGFVTGITGIWLTMKQNPWCFPVGLVNVIISFFLFYEQKLYSDCIQQVFYSILLAYGWYCWLFRSEHTTKPLIVSYSSHALLMLLLFLCLTYIAVSGYLFHRFTDASYPWLDAVATGISFTAQWMIARKKIEHWLLWMIVNLLYIYIYAQKELWLYALLFLVYFALAVNGWMTWKKSVEKNVHG